MAEKYDSKQDTIDHIGEVQKQVSIITSALECRSFEHDKSKLEFPEKEIFDRVTPRLKTLTYGSDEYKDSLVGMGPALQHHYESNKHHPEHYENGIDGMCLVDLIEMYCDWIAATKRHADGDMNKSIEINKKRFNMSSQLASIFRNTHKRHGS